MEPGTKVIIRQNPHHPGAENIVGTVIVFRPGEKVSGAVTLSTFTTSTQGMVKDIPCLLVLPA